MPSGGRTDTVGVIEIPLIELDVDPQVQPRTNGQDAAHVKALEDNPKAWPPVVTARLPGDGRLHLVDGFHRDTAAKNLALKTIRVRVVDVDEGTDLRSLAFDLNKRHGLAYTLADREAEAARRLFTNPATSNLEVARATLLSPTTIAAIRTRLEEQGTIRPTPQRVNRAGRAFTPVIPHRKAGELPAESLAELAADLGARVISSKERLHQRRIASYFKRLVVALEEQADIDDLTLASAAEAISAVLGEDESIELGERMGRMSWNCLEIAKRLGYDPGDEP